MSRFVTRTGRVIAPGIVTRASLKIRTRNRHQEKPLPIHLQCHPKALSPTTRNPLCQTFKAPHITHGLRLADSLTVQQLLRGKGLRHKGRFELGGLKTASRFTDDIRQAMSYQTAADVLIKLPLEVIDNGSR